MYNHKSIPALDATLEKREIEPRIPFPSNFSFLSKFLHSRSVIETLERAVVLDLIIKEIQNTILKAMWMT